MTVAQKQACATPGCPRTVDRGHCQEHARAYERARGNRHQRGYTNQWAAYSKRRLAEHPWCVGYPIGYHRPHRVMADCTDHILSARSRPDLFWEETNHQSLCSTCNSRKAIAEEGALHTTRGGSGV